MLLAGLLSACGTGNGSGEETALTSPADSPGEVQQSAVYEETYYGDAAEESLPPITADTDLISPAAVSFPMEQTEGDVAAFADVNHDGKEERIVFGLKEYADSGIEAGFVKVLDGTDENAPVLWEEDYGTAHVGWKNFYLYREDGRDYLVRYIPYMNTGLGEFQLHIFSLDEHGAPVMLRTYETNFSVSKPDSSKLGFYGDTDKMTEFLEQTDACLSESLLLVSTDEGNLAYSTPEAPITFQNPLMSLFGNWDVTGEGSALEVFRLTVEKNWLETEAIPILCAEQRWQEANHLDINISIKGISRKAADIDEVMDQLFYELGEDNWKYLPEKEMPEEAPDVLICISRTPGADFYVSCFKEKELAVIWSAPYAADMENHMEAVSECYRLSGNAVEGIMKWIADE